MFSELWLECGLAKDESLGAIAKNQLHRATHPLEYRALYNQFRRLRSVTKT
jgi:hypothetical protein